MIDFLHLPGYDKNKILTIEKNLVNDAHFTIASMQDELNQLKQLNKTMEDEIQDLRVKQRFESFQLEIFNLKILTVF